MDTGESVTTEALEKEVQERCPFKESEEGVDSDDDESIGDDDDDDVQDEQENDGGTLGRNLVAGSHGAGGTVGGLAIQLIILTVLPKKRRQFMSLKAMRWMRMCIRSLLQRIISYLVTRLSAKAHCMISLVPAGVEN